MEVADRARKGAARDGKRCEFNAGRPRRAAPTVRATKRKVPGRNWRCGTFNSTLLVLIEEDREMASHVGFVEGVFGSGRFPGGRAAGGLC